MKNYHNEVVSILQQYSCLRLDEIGDGIFKWYSQRNGVTFNVDPIIPSRIHANEILERAGIGPLIK
jgi:hypothetical protein